MTKTESVLGGGRKFWVANSDALTHLKAMPDECVDCVVTSPPYYGLRDYGAAGQIGLEKTPEEYIAALVVVFAEVRRVLKPKGTCFVNLGDSYSAGGGVIKAKDLVGIPWMFAFALRAAGWYLRQEITWHKPNPTPESVRDRCVRATESIFLFAKSPRYFWNHEANQEPALGRTMYASAGRYGDHHGKRDGRVYDVRTSRNVWSLSPVRIKWEGTTKHFAAFPESLPLRCLRVGCPGLSTSVVYDPFCGSGQTGRAAMSLGLSFLGTELNPEYAILSRERIAAAVRKRGFGFFA